MRAASFLLEPSPVFFWPVVIRDAGRSGIHSDPLQALPSHRCLAYAYAQQQRSWPYDWPTGTPRHRWVYQCGCRPHPLGLGRISHSIVRSSPLSRSPVNVASIAPSPVNSKNVNTVGLKDAPLQSLFPAEPKPPAPVGHLHVPTAHAWRHGASFGHRPVLHTHMSFVSDPLLRASSNSAWLGGMGLAPSR